MDYPLLKSSKKSKKKTKKATWDDSDESASGSDEEVANFCFMAHSDQEDEQEDEVILESLSYHELFKFVDEMQTDLEKLSSKYVGCSKYVGLKKKYKTSVIENKSLLNEISCLKENGHNIVKIDVPCEKHVFDCDEKNALINKVKFFEYDCCEKDS